MELLTLLVLIVVLEEVLLFLWMRFVLKGLKFVRTIDEDTAYVGDRILVTVESYNYKILPIPWIRYNEDIPQHMLVHGPKLDVTKTKLNNDLITVTSLFSFQKITRRYFVEPTQRGDYFFKDVEIEVGDYFGAHKRRVKFEANHRLIVYPKVYPLKSLIHLDNNPQGEVSVKRWIMPDPIDVTGTRAYTGREPFHAIDWRATAKINELQVKQYDFHADPALMVVLSLQTNDIEWFERDNQQAERLILVAASIIEAACPEIAVGLSMTATLSSGESLFIKPKRSYHQRMYLMDALAKATYYNTCSLDVLLHRITRQSQPYQTVVVIAAILNATVIDSMNKMIKDQINVLLVTMENTSTEHLNSKILVYRMTEDDIENLRREEADR